MINFSRRDRAAESNEGVKPTLSTASYANGQSHTHPTASSTGTPTGGVARQPYPQRQPTVREASPPPSPMPRESPPASPPPASSMKPSEPAAATLPPPAEGSKLFIGVNILLKGVEISNCDALVIEGNVEATVKSKAMEISRPGTLKGTALIDVAEIHGDFAGDLTARTRLVVHGTGRVEGTIRYGKLVVAEGGELSGDIKCLDSDASRSSKDGASAA